MNYTLRLRNRLVKNAIHLTNNNNISGEEFTSSFIFDDVSMNFSNKSFSEIKKKHDWSTRIQKKHPSPHLAVSTLEMQSCNSSDALLMNIFCHPQIKEWKSVRDLLSISFSDKIIFGWNPEFENEKSIKTEIDMKIGNTIFEAKLTESDFTSKSISVVKGYRNFSSVFDYNNLKVIDGNVLGYQLIRNILTAEKYQYKFILLVDETRTDLIRDFYDIKSAIINSKLRDNVNFITWQEIVNSCGKDLKEYISKKYF